MPSYDVIDEAIINAPSERVYRALVDEWSGVTHWWSQVEAKPIGDIPFGQVGAVCSSTVRNRGTARFKWRLTEVDPGRFMRSEYFEGPLIGYGDVRLEPVGEDKTRISYHWQVRTRGIGNILGPMLNIKKRHSEVIQNGFRALGEHLAR